jgi:hypothetical protein
MPNLTLSIDTDLLKRARKIAIEKDTSLTGLIRDYLEELVRYEETRNEIDATELERLFSKSPMVVGEKKWNREELHER